MNAVPTCAACGRPFHRPSRSAAQNSTYWQFLTDLQGTQILEWAGHEKAWWHTFMKAEFLVDIYTRDDPGYAEMMLTVRDLKDVDGHQAIVDGIIALTSTAQASVAQFSEYLACIERWAHSRGISLRTDSGIYLAACGDFS